MTVAKWISRALDNGIMAVWSYHIIADVQPNIFHHLMMWGMIFFMALALLGAALAFVANSSR